MPQSCDTAHLDDSRSLPRRSRLAATSLAWEHSPSRLPDASAPVRRRSGRSPRVHRRCRCGVRRLPQAPWSASTPALDVSGDGTVVTAEDFPTAPGCHTWYESADFVNGMATPTVVETPLGVTTETTLVVAPVISTVASKVGPDADFISTITLTGTFGLPGTTTGLVYGPMSSDGFCTDVSWVGAPEFAPIAPIAPIVTTVTTARTSLGRSLATRRAATRSPRSGCPRTTRPSWSTPRLARSPRRCTSRKSAVASASTPA